MKKILRSAWLGPTLGAIALCACDAPPSPQPAAPPARIQAVPAGEAVLDVIRKDLADICRDQDPYSRARRLGALLPTLGPEMVPAVQRTLENLLLDLRGTEVELLTWFWATHQPKEAALWAKDKAPVGYRDAAVYAALRVWAQADPQAAVSLAWPWTDIRTLEVIVPIGLVRGWYAKGDPPELHEWLRSLPPSVISQRAIAAYARVKIEQEGSDAVMQWAQSLPDEKDKTFKQTVFRRVVDLLGHLDSEAAMRWCEAQCEGPYGSNIRQIIGRNWARRDAPAAMAWLSTSPPGYETNLALRMTWADWSREDRAAAMAWMAAQTQGEPAAWLRPIYPVYARLLSGESPTDAIRWASQIQDQREREFVLIGVARVWRTIDEAAAFDWLAHSTLSEAAREQVRAPLDKRPQPPS